MGFEAYRIAVRLEENVSKNDIKNKLIQLGGNIINEDSKQGYVNIDFNLKQGVIEVLLENPYEIHRDLYGNEKLDEVKNQLRIYIRFAKPNSIKIVDKIIQLLMKLDEDYKIKGILDLQSKNRILLSDYREFKSNVVASKEEFDKYYPGIKYPIKCEAVFKEYRRINPEKYE
ncbi:AsnC family transcriptional regulator [Clostridium saccharoperbutylacetonicum]|uniref:AsnC family transcriptional regulator n=1 Tax=Clostridium saccharoperbutylacetonicum TaxID=36745 RepID=UPI0039EB896D